MFDLTGSKLEFLRDLTGVGAFISVILVFVATNKEPFFTSYILIFGLLFGVADISSAAILRFTAGAPQGRLLRHFKALSYTFLAVGFGGLVTVGVGMAISLIPGEYPVLLVYEGVTLAIFGSFVGPTLLVMHFLIRGDGPRRPPPFYIR